METANIGKVRPCRVPQCKTCKFGYLDIDTTFHSNICNGTWQIKDDMSCLSRNIIYLITCNHPGCKMKYVGYTTDPLNKRFSHHRNHITAGTEARLMLEHFTKYHRINNMKIKPIEICKDQKNLRDRERHWMRELNSLYPYGLNDRYDQDNLHDAYIYVTSGYPNTKSIYEHFNKVESRRSNRTSGSQKTTPSQHNGDSTNELDCGSFLNNIVTNYNGDNLIKTLRTSLFALSKENIEKMFLYTCISTNIICATTPFFTLVVKDMCIYKLNSMAKVKEDNTNKKYFVINFVNKLLEQIKLKEIFSSERITSMFPATRNTKDVREPCISYKYTNPIRSDVLNYRQALTEEEMHPSICNCNSYDNTFIDSHHSHVFTGNLAIVKNNSLRNLLRKGLNFREPQPPNKNKAFQSIISSLDSYIYSMSGTLNKSVDTFHEWKMAILTEVKKRLDNITPYVYNKVLVKNSEAEKALIKLQKDFVLIPVDKAGNNIAIVCKYYYISLLNNELSSNNFNEVNINKETILDTHQQFLAKFAIEVSSKQNKLPFLYFTAKMHKTPISNRFITSSKSCTLSELSEKVGLCLKTLLKCSKNYSTYDSKYQSNMKNYYIIDNNVDVIKFLNQSNKLNSKHKSIATYDFKTLYTSIPHNLLKKQLKRFIEGVFKRKGKRYIVPYKNGGYFTNNKNGFSVKQLIECINFVIDNSYVGFCGKVYRQVIGIPMGTNCAPYLANIFLHMYEVDFIEKLNIDGKYRVASLFNNVFRYQDDCLVLNDCKQFSRYIASIYPEEMVLENTNISRVVSNYLDLCITLNNGNFSYKSYDKREDYMFDVIRYPDLSGNIPFNPTYGVFISQCKRFAEINSSLEYFVRDIRMLQSRLVKQGFLLGKLRDRFNTFANKNFYTWCKFGIDIRNAEVVDQIFNN